ncbi:hypothetical protein HY418_01465 [Candidatus Kaiserbacteria bacterium]|nr:hypothetical protein [Candidatus Kaiserbacteria bacterium]
MNLERSILTTFLGNYFINTVAAALVSLIPASAGGGIFTPQYITFVVLAVIVTAFLAWWQSVRGFKAGLIFGIVGFVVAIATAFVTGLSGVLGQTGSISQMVGILPNFWPFLASWSTLVLLGYWIIPPVVVGWLKGHGMPAPASTTAM